MFLVSSYRHLVASFSCKKHIPIRKLTHAFARMRKEVLLHLAFVVSRLSMFVTCLVGAHVYFQHFSHPWPKQETQVDLCTSKGLSQK